MEKTQVETVVIHPPFPNPSSEEIKISFTLPDHSNNQNVRMSLTDMMGRKYWSYQNSFSSGYQEVMWKRSNEANGIYIISVQSGTSIKQMKVILK
jgi:type IX secretion system substrate protein